jgi:hypothetical protein
MEYYWRRTLQAFQFAPGSDAAAHESFHEAGSDSLIRAAGGMGWRVWRTTPHAAFYEAGRPGVEEWALS